MNVQGLASLEAQLVELGAQLGIKALAQASRRAFKPVLEAAQRLVPVDTGELRDAIKLSVKKPKDGESVVVVGLWIGKGAKGSKKIPSVRRWHWVELGTAHMAAHPYLRPALDQNAGAVLELLKTELVKSIQKAAAKKGSK